MITTKNSIYVLPAARRICVWSKKEATRTKNTYLYITFKMKHSKSVVINMYVTDERSANQLEKVLPVVLGHESEEGQEGPAKRVKTGVTEVGVPPSLHAGVSFWALPINKESASYNCSPSIQIPLSTIQLS